jgi:arylsulfatase
LVALWLVEAKKNNALPLNDLDIGGIHALEYKVAPPENGRYVYYPGTTEIPEASAARTLECPSRSWRRSSSPPTRRCDRLAGSRFGGYTLFVKDGQLCFVYNFLGIPPEQKLGCQAPKSGKHVVGVGFEKKSMGENNEVLGRMTLYVDEKPAGSGDFRTQSGHYALAGEGLAIGYDSGDRCRRNTEQVHLHRRPDSQGDL